MLKMSKYINFKKLKKIELFNYNKKRSLKYNK